MPVCQVPALSIRCDDCDREWAMVPVCVPDLHAELHDAEECGWVVSDPIGGDRKEYGLICPSCQLDYKHEDRD